MINIRIRNAGKVARQIKDYTRSLGAKLNTFLEKLADIGITQAAIHFQSAEYDGVNDVVVDSSPTWLDEHTLAINASGESILFIEFGTGVYNPVTHPKADELGMIRGAYGKGYGQNYTWYYRGDPGTNGEDLGNGRIRTHGNNANRCMWDASEEMRRRIYDIAKEVFS